MLTGFFKCIEFDIIVVQKNNLTTMFFFIFTLLESVTLRQQHYYSSSGGGRNRGGRRSIHGCLLSFIQLIICLVHCYCYLCVGVCVCVCVCCVCVLCCLFVCFPFQLSSDLFVQYQVTVPGAILLSQKNWHKTRQSTFYST